MKSITIHGLEDPLNAMIRMRAKKQKTSLNKTIKQLLREALGLKPIEDEDRRADFVDLFGTWSKDDLNEFSQKTVDFEKIDQTDWL